MYVPVNQQQISSVPSSAHPVSGPQANRSQFYGLPPTRHQVTGVPVNGQQSNDLPSRGPTSNSLPFTGHQFNVPSVNGHQFSGLSHAGQQLSGFPSNGDMLDGPLSSSPDYNGFPSYDPATPTNLYYRNSNPEHQLSELSIHQDPMAFIKQGTSGSLSEHCNLKGEQQQPESILNNASLLSKEPVNDLWANNGGPVPGSVRPGLKEPCDPPSCESSGHNELFTPGFRNSVGSGTQHHGAPAHQMCRTDQRKAPQQASLLLHKRSSQPPLQPSLESCMSQQAHANGRMRRSEPRDGMNSYCEQVSGNTKVGKVSGRIAVTYTMLSGTIDLCCFILLSVTDLGIRP